MGPALIRMLGRHQFAIGGCMRSGNGNDAAVVQQRDSDIDPRSDEQLVTAINYGDEQAFAALYRRYRDWVVNLAYRFTQDRDAALDVLQETFMYVLRKTPNLTLTAKMTTFLYPVVRHLAIGAAKKRRRQLPAAPADVADAAPPTVDDPADAEDPREALASLVDGLPQTHRETLLLRFVDGLSIAEIAEALGIPAGTVKSRLHHALGRLRGDPRTRKYFDL
jgi:RNA polymerase sigma-70 factor (ECF subfamily)